MFILVSTVDYELPAHREADVLRYIIQPTDTLLEIFQSYGAKLTIMVEIGELWAFENAKNAGFKEHLGYDPVKMIQHQLVDAVQNGHDVQLHLHPQWLGARWLKDVWELDYSKYQFTSLDFREMVDILRSGKEYLENLLGPHCDDYSCIGFRAGNWITQPSGKYLRALHEAGLKSDTSVFKWGYINTPSVYLDYRDANSNIIPWLASWDDINIASRDGAILEFPIYAEPTSILGMFSMKRLRMAMSYLLEDRRNVQAVKTSAISKENSRVRLLNKMRRIFSTYPKKLDFCKLTLKEMLQMVENLKIHCVEDPTEIFLPVVISIGHSKEPISREDIDTFFGIVSKRFGDSLRFSTYREIVKEYLQRAKKILNKSTNSKV